MRLQSNVAGKRRRKTGPNSVGASVLDVPTLLVYSKVVQDICVFPGVAIFFFMCPPSIPASPRRELGFQLARTHVGPTNEGAA
jgi:hypothetical protein